MQKHSNMRQFCLCRNGINSSINWSTVSAHLAHVLTCSLSVVSYGISCLVAKPSSNCVDMQYLRWGVLTGGQCRALGRPSLHEVYVVALTAPNALGRIVTGLSSDWLLRNYNVPRLRHYTYKRPILSCCRLHNFISKFSHNPRLAENERCIP